MGREDYGTWLTLSKRKGDTLNENILNERISQFTPCRGQIKHLKNL
jgi:hypothetical protein